MLQAYVDESASQTGERRAYMATYVDTVERWEAFVDAWAVALESPPRIGVFHMVEAQNRSGEFLGWSEEARDKKVWEMAAVITRFGPRPFHVSMSISDFDELVKPHVPYPLTTPYFPLVYALIYGVTRTAMQLGHRTPCDFIFDSQDGLSKRVNMFWDDACSDLPNDACELIGGSPIFRDDKEVLPLQAADMFAWHIRRFVEDGCPPQYAGLLEAIASEEDHHFTHLDRPTLSGIGRDFSVSNEGGLDINSKSGWKRFLKELGGVWPPPTPK